MRRLATFFWEDVMRTLVALAAALSLFAANGAWAQQQKQKVSYKVGAESTKYLQRYTIDVGDESGHQLAIFEIHRTFAGNAPVINGVRLKESFTRGFSDFTSGNGLSTSYGVMVGENGDRFYTLARTMGQADGTGKRTTISVGEIRGGTGKFAGMKGMTRSQGASDGKRGFNETSAEIEYWFSGH
jgi:hypothetical protein